MGAATKAELEARVARLEKSLTEALEREKATGEILRVISRSPTDTQAVFDAIVRTGLDLFSGATMSLRLVKGDFLETVASTKPIAKDGGEFRAPVNDDRYMTSRSVRSKEVLHIPDVDAADWLSAQSKERARQRGYQAVLHAPMLRGGEAIGTVVLTRPTPGRFTDKEIALLTTFADQAVIVIENARLFNETKEALQQQTVIGEILRIISSSPTDTQPVFDAIVKSGVRFFGGMNMSLRLVKDENTVTAAATVPVRPETGGEYPAPLSDLGGLSARAIHSREVVQIPDLLDPPDWVSSLTKKRAELRGYRANMAAPMLREGRAIGTLNLTRATAGPLTAKQVSLLRTFADQAVIAIENVRLFKELEARNAEVTEALEQQTATAEILRVISSSPTDIQPVLDAVAESAARLCDTTDVYIRRIDNETTRIVAHVGTTPILPEGYVRPLRLRTVVGTVAREGKTIHIPDVTEPHVHEKYSDSLAVPGTNEVRTLLYVPLLREGKAIGVIVLRRREVHPFTDKQIQLLETFAAQAVIAIENVRLFKELQAQTEALSRSVNQLTALGEVGQAISSTLDLETVLQTIVSRALQLTGLDSGSIYEFDQQAQVFRLQAAENYTEEIVEAVRKTPIRTGDGVVGRTGVTRELTQVADILDASYQSGRRDLLLRAGYRALLAVPLLRDEQLLGVLLVSRKTPGAFAPETVDLLKTFATQSALAIHNARLFREIAEKSRQLEVASQHKSQFLASMSHELRTPLNAILGFNEMILDEIYGPVAPDVRSPLEEMQASGKHLLRLINNVLDLAKIEAGRMELSLQDYSVNDTVESVRSTLRSIAAEKELELLTVVPADIPLAYGDPGRMSQCLLNLAGNALKFTKAGKVEIGAKLEGDQLVYRVSDTGIGIPADKIETLFTEFKQTDATVASEYGGTGLGLSITKKFIEMHGGRIWVESELGKGSAFIFEVPLRATTT